MEEWDFAKSLYFCVTTVTTIGFGDVYPDADSTSMLLFFMILVGWGFTAFTIASIGALFSDLEQRSHNALLQLQSQFSEQKWMQTDFSSMLSRSSNNLEAKSNNEVPREVEDSHHDRVSSLGQSLQFAAVKKRTVKSKNDR